MTDVLKQKDYPLNYSRDVLKVIDTISMTHGGDITIVGSMSLKSQQYAGDYDLIETVRGRYKDTSTAVKYYVKRFQTIVKKLMNEPDLTIGDIKAGTVEEWVVIPEEAGISDGAVKGYDYRASKDKIAELHSNGILTEEEYKYANKICLENPSIEEFLIMKKELRFHLVRWTPKEVKQGVVKLRDGRQMSLEEAFTSPSIIKLDAVAWVQNNRFTDFSIIYLLTNKGIGINKVDTSKGKWSIKQDLLYYLLTKNYYKACKRLFSLARESKDLPLIAKLNTMLNSDLGRLYGIISDCGSLLYLLENETQLPLDKIKYELDQFRSRLGNIYSISVGGEGDLKKLVRADGLPKNAQGRKRMIELIESLQGRFEQVLSKQSLAYMQEHSLLPIAKKYLP
jgi:hypothetical protein